MVTTQRRTHMNLTHTIDNRFNRQEEITDITQPMLEELKKGFVVKGEREMQARDTVRTAMVVPYDPAGGYALSYPLRWRPTDLDRENGLLRDSVEEVIKGLPNEISDKIKEFLEKAISDSHGSGYAAIIHFLSFVKDSLLLLAKDESKDSLVKEFIKAAVNISNKIYSSNSTQIASLDAESQSDQEKAFDEVLADLLNNYEERKRNAAAEGQHGAVALLELYSAIAREVRREAGGIMRKLGCSISEAIVIRIQSTIARLVIAPKQTHISTGMLDYYGVANDFMTRFDKKMGRIAPTVLKDFLADKPFVGDKPFILLLRHGITQAEYSRLKAAYPN